MVELSIELACACMAMPRSLMTELEASWLAARAMSTPTIFVPASIKLA